MATKARIERPPGSRGSLRSTVGLVGAVLAVALVAVACGSDEPGMSADPVADAQAKVATAQGDLADAQRQLTQTGQVFCSTAASYVAALDRYGKLFTASATTVGDVRTAGADLVAPRQDVSVAATAVTKAQGDVAAAEKELADAQAALDDAERAAAGGSSASTASTAPTTTTSSTLVPPVAIDRVEQAETDLKTTAQGITDQTPLVRATVEYQSAAFALEVAWLKLLADGGCLSDQQRAAANEQVMAYTLALQTQLQQAGYYHGGLDGIYGPQTVAAVQELQTEAGLPPTGLVDRATALALDKKVAAAGQPTSSSPADSQTAALQTVLALTGYWTGPIDGIWSDQLTASLMRFQTALGVAPSGVVDAATLAAFEQALAATKTTTASTTTTTTPAPPSATGTTVGTTTTAAATTSTAQSTTTSSTIVIPTSTTARR